MNGTIVIASPIFGVLVTRSVATNSIDARPRTSGSGAEYASSWTLHAALVAVPTGVVPNEGGGELDEHATQSITAMRFIMALG
jgi:hypothetical protein